MAGALIKRENAKRVSEGKLPQPKRRQRAGAKKSQDVSKEALAKTFDSLATASAVSGGDDGPPAKRQKQNEATYSFDEFLDIAPSHITSESMETHHSDDSGYESGDEESISVLTNKILNQLSPPPQRPNTPNKTPQRPTTLALDTSPPSGNQGKCIWCLTVRSLLPGKRFCAECSAQGCECAYCHRPMPERFFTFSERLCNACFKKDAKQKAKRRSRKH